MKKSRRRTYVALLNAVLLIIATFVVGTKCADVEAVVVTTAKANITAEPQVTELSPDLSATPVYYTYSNQRQDEDDFEAESAEQAEEIFEPYINLSSEDVYELATLVYLEGHTESYECRCAIASVVLNRMTTRNMTLQEVIYEKNQFSPAYLISSTKPTDEEIDAVLQVCTFGPTLPEYVTFFRANYYFSWVEPYTFIDSTYFSYDPAVKERIDL